MKNFLSAILVMLQLFSVNAFAGSEKLSEIQKQDLYNLGIMTGDENGDLKLNDTITRAEATKMICVAGNFKLPSSVCENLFNDTSDSHWAFDYINVAKENGIINGDENGNFNPDSYITNEEIIKMIVCLIGYGEMAEMKSGYPAGYKAVASQIGITAGLTLKPETPAIREDVAVMISNALDIPVMAKKNDDANGNAVYIVLDGKGGRPFSTIRGTRGTIWDTSLTNIDKLAQSFASQYPYKEGDTEKSFTLYPNIIYSSGMEKTADGTEYECPAIYDDRHAHHLVNSMSVMPVKIETENESFETQYALFDSEVLVPYNILNLAGCNASFNKDTYVATISYDDTVLEILPNIIGMRKNQANGFWVPLEVCARFIGDTLYIPLEAVAAEFGYKIKINSEGTVITIK